MPIANPNEVTTFSTDYDAIGEYVGDGELVPYFNPTAPDRLILPGEPFLRAFGPASEEQVYLTQGPIRPGDIGFMFAPGRWVADLPCDLSASVVDGQELYWDEDNSVCSLVGDVTNGYVVGYASWAIDPNVKNTAPSVDAVNRVICGTTTSTNIRVRSRDEVATIKGTISSF